MQKLSKEDESRLLQVMSYIRSAINVVYTLDDRQLSLIFKDELIESFFNIKEIVEDSINADV